MSEQTGEQLSEPQPTRLNCISRTWRSWHFKRIIPTYNTVQLEAWQILLPPDRNATGLLANTRVEIRISGKLTYQHNSPFALPADPQALLIHLYVLTLLPGFLDPESQALILEFLAQTKGFEPPDMLIMGEGVLITGTIGFVNHD